MKESTRMRVLIFLIGFSTVSISLSAVYGDGGYFQYGSLCSYRDRLRSEISVLEDRVYELEQQIREMEDPGFRIEKIAREEFGLIRTGEVVIYFNEADFEGIIGDESGLAKD